MKKVMMAAVLSMMAAGLQAQRSGNTPLRDSLRIASEALAFHPDSIDLRLKKASWNIELGQWDYAKDEYDQVLRQQPDNVAGLYYRAFVNEKLGRYKFARLDYQNLLTLVPSNFEAQLGLALLNEKDHHLTEALDGINLLVAQHPDSAIAYAARGGMEKGRGMMELAAFDYGEAVRRDPTNTDYLINLADLQIRLRQGKAARATLRRLERLGIPRPALKEFYDRLK